MHCCTIKLKRSWEYCPGCGEEISWPPSEAQRAKWKAEHERKMATDPLYAKRHEERQRWLDMYAGKAVWDFAGDLPLLQMEVNRIQSAEVAVMAGKL